MQAMMTQSSAEVLDEVSVLSAHGTAGVLESLCRAQQLANELISFLSDQRQSAS